MHGLDPPKASTPGKARAGATATNPCFWCRVCVRVALARLGNNVMGGWNRPTRQGTWFWYSSASQGTCGGPNSRYLLATPLPAPGLASGQERAGLGGQGRRAPAPEARTRAASFGPVARLRLPGLPVEEKSRPHAAGAPSVPSSPAPPTCSGNLAPCAQYKSRCTSDEPSRTPDSSPILQCLHPLPPPQAVADPVSRPSARLHHQRRLLAHASRFSPRIPFIPSQPGTIHTSHPRSFLFRNIHVASRHPIIFESDTQITVHATAKRTCQLLFCVPTDHRCSRVHHRLRRQNNARRASSRDGSRGTTNRRSPTRNSLRFLCRFASLASDTSTTLPLNRQCMGNHCD